jgi:hypothetical protein
MTELFQNENGKQHQRLRAACLTASKATPFDALQKAGIRIVLVEFDGEGDSGQIEGIRATDGDQYVPLPRRPDRYS